MITHSSVSPRQSSIGVLIGREGWVEKATILPAEGWSADLHALGLRAKFQLML